MYIFLVRYCSAHNHIYKCDKTVVVNSTFIYLFICKGDLSVFGQEFDNFTQCSFIYCRMTEIRTNIKTSNFARYQFVRV